MEKLEIMTDIELVFDMVEHIEKPCFFPKDSPEYFGLRKSYICMAQDLVLPTLTNPFAIEYLNQCFKKYGKK